jgi:phosphomevalonate kinase
VKAHAPGKLVLTGAYAVLDGAPAIVAAVDRYAVADASRQAESPASEVRAALHEEAAPAVDASAMHDVDGRKLGLGSSAAVLVASLAARALVRGEDVRDDAVRARLFATARAAHARAQGGGSGVDVAASVYGGLLRYSIAAHGPAIRAVPMPADLVIRVYFGGSSARTSDMRRRVAAAAADRSSDVTPIARAMAETASGAADAIEVGDTDGFVRLARAFGGLLASLGDVAAAPIVLPALANLAVDAARENAAFLPSGAGGGDVTVWLGRSPPPPSFTARAGALGLRPLDLSVDLSGVQPRFG